MWLVLHGSWISFHMHKYGTLYFKITSIISLSIFQAEISLIIPAPACKAKEATFPLKVSMDKLTLGNLFIISSM